MGFWRMTKSKMKVMEFLLKENQNMQGRRKSYTVLMFCLCLCVQAGGGGAERGRASKLVRFLYGSLENRVYSGE